MRRCQPKVAYITSIYRDCEVFHLPYFQLLQNMGCEVHVFAAADDGKAAVERVGVICHDTVIRRNPYSLRNVVALYQLLRGLRKERFALVHVHTPTASVLGRIAAWLTGVPNVLYTAHGFHFFQGAPWRNWLLYYPLERWLSRITDVLITINEEDYARARRFPVRWQVVRVNGVGVPETWYAMPEWSPERTALRAKLGIPQDALLVLCPAELTRNKNQQQLLEALHLVKDELPLHCLLVGDGPERQRLEQLAERLGIADRVHLLGYRRDVANLMATSDLCVLVSKREGLPRAIMEAMAAAKPVVATDVRGNRDLVRDGENGYLVPVGDHQALAAALVRLGRDEALRRRMGRRSRQLAAPYRLRDCVAQLAAVYRASLFGPEREQAEETFTQEVGRRLPSEPQRVERSP